MFDFFWDWVFYALPWKAQVGCLAITILAIGAVLLWCYYR